MSNEYLVRWLCSSPRPKKPSTFELLCVPFCHSQVARHSNFAASGAAVSASRAPSSASTFTPLLTGVSVAVIGQLLHEGPRYAPGLLHVPLAHARPPRSGRGVPGRASGEICGDPLHADR